MFCLTIFLRLHEKFIKKSRSIPELKDKTLHVFVEIKQELYQNNTVFTD